MITLRQLSRPVTVAVNGKLVLVGPQPRRPFDVAGWPTAAQLGDGPILLSVDMSRGDGPSWCGLVALQRRADVEVVVAARSRLLRYDAAATWMAEEAERLCADCLLVEDSSVGQALVRDAAAAATLPPVLTVPQPGLGKLERAAAAAARSVLALSLNLDDEDRAGLQQLSLFPDAERDDVADALTQALHHLRGSLDCVVTPRLYAVLRDGREVGLVWEHRGRWQAAAVGARAYVQVAGPSAQSRDYAVAAIAGGEA